jgi:hypothetical protein
VIRSWIIEKKIKELKNQTTINKKEKEKEKQWNY